jgi:septal ring-binding cell division protein DamX
LRYKGFGNSHINMEKTEMSRTVTRIIAPLALSILTVLGACKDNKSSDTLAQDTALNRDLQLANADSAAQPQLTDVPAGTVAPAPTAPAPTSPTPRATAPRRATAPVVRTPVRTRPAPAPAPVSTTTSSGNTVTRGTGGSERSVGMIAAGSTVNLTSNTRVCTNTHRVGQRFSATVSESITGSNGATIPAGATANV